MWRAVRTPYGGPVPTPRDSAVANQLIGLEDWGGNISLRSGSFLSGVENRESCRRSGELVFGMGNSRSGVGILFLGWGVFGDTTLVWEIRALEWGVSF